MNINIKKDVFITNLSNESIRDYYKKYVKKNKKSTFFHTIEYYNVLAKTKGIEPISFIAYNSAYEILAATYGELTNEYPFLPKISKRLIIYSPPLYQKIEYLEIILSKLTNIKKPGLFIQIRSFYPFTEQELAVYKKYGFIFTDHLNAYIKLKNKNAEDIYSMFKKDKKKGIKKSQRKYKLIIKEFDDINFSVNTFYHIQKELYKKRHHSLKSKTYFYNLLKESNNMVKIAFAVYKLKPIAAQLYIIYKNTITTLYTATLSNHYDKHAGDLLIWYLVQKATENRLDTFDFGGGGDPFKNYSPRDYKKRFGASFDNVGRLIKPTSILFKIGIYLYYKLILKYK